MNRYPWWKYALLAVALLVGLLYTVPNFYGEAPAVQVSSGKATVKVDAAMVDRVRQAVDVPRRVDVGGEEPSVHAGAEVAVGQQLGAAFVLQADSVDIQRRPAARCQQRQLQQRAARARRRLQLGGVQPHLRTLPSPGHPSAGGRAVHAAHRGQRRLVA